LYSSFEEEMSEETNTEPGRRRRRRRRKRGTGSATGSAGSSGSTSASNSQPGSQQQRPQGQSNRPRRAPQPQQPQRRKTPTEKFGGREPMSDVEWDDNVLPLNAFELFCTYYLGITADNKFRKPVAREVARRFDRSLQEIDDALKNCGMSPDIVKKISFDMSLAQLDISVAPEGIDKKELAKNLFEEFIAENPHFVDWAEPESDDDESDDEDESGDDEEE